MKSKQNLLKKQKKLLEQLAKIGPFVEGSLSVVNRICGTKTCRCMNGGKKHPAMFLTWKDKRKTKALYIPVKKHKIVKLYHQNYKKLKKIIRSVSDVQKMLISTPSRI